MVPLPLASPSLGGVTQATFALIEAKQLSQPLKPALSPIHEGSNLAKQPIAQAIGLDFGTTNTVAAIVNACNNAETIQFGNGPEAASTLRSVISFWREQESGSIRTEGGPWAIEHFIEFPGETRFLQSFKTFAASPLFDTTGIFGKRLRFEDILEAFFRTVLRHGGEPLQHLPKTLVLGRPVKFAGQNADAETARTRYEAAFTRFGFDRIVHVLEPVAAAYYYAQRLTKSANVLVGDFGGGTSDFSVLRFDGAGGDFRAFPLAHSGVGLAGDTFDYRIIDAVISPQLGKGSTYESWGKILTVPSHYFAAFAKWNELCLLKHSPAMRELKSLAKQSTDPAKLDSLIRLIEFGAIYSLYTAVSRVKTRLSTETEAELVFRDAGIDIRATVRRHDFEAWIKPDLDRIELCVAEALAAAGLDHSRVDKVFLTGGTSLVPAVQGIFDRLFGAARVETGDELLAVASGLALIGQDQNIGRWEAE